MLPGISLILSADRESNRREARSAQLSQTQAISIFDFMRHEA
jgi:hypothetical protein